LALTCGVHRGLDGQQDQGDDQDRPVTGVAEVPAEPGVAQSDGIDDDAGVHRRHGDEQRDAVEPADEPAELRAHRVLAVLVERAGHRIVAGQLAEHQGDQEHPGNRYPGKPDVGGSAEAEAESEQGKDADHRRQVRERDGEVSEQPEDAIQLRPVAKVLEPGVIVVEHSRLRSAGCGRVGWRRAG
jgi:hypothetical protein